MSVVGEVTCPVINAACTDWDDDWPGCMRIRCPHGQAAQTRRRAIEANLAPAVHLFDPFVVLRSVDEVIERNRRITEANYGT